MRPIKLTLQNINSFRETQTIDFEYLTGGGVFGIFGPTGSGKSSILDAMTYALYAKSNKEAGEAMRRMINMNETEAAVSFIFELGDKNPKRYRVERSFSRAEDGSTKSNRQRLVEVTPLGDVVLAEQYKAVNQKVEDILGLNWDDFTRAVVLPQGKFAEFLTLPGRDKRQMFERIFGLEIYGTALNQQVKKGAEKIGKELGEKRALLDGLGEVSEEKLAESKLLYENLQTDLAGLVSVNEKLKTKVNDYKKLADDFLELDTYKTALSEHQKQASEISSLKALLTSLEEALVIKPYYVNLTSARKALGLVEAIVLECGEEVAKLKPELEQAETNYKILCNEKENQEPNLVLEIQKLAEAVEIANEIATDKRYLTNLLKELNEIKSKEEELNLTLTQKKEETNTLETQRKDITNQIIDNQVAPSHREEIHQADFLLEQFKEKVKTIKKEKQSLANLDEKIQEETTNLENVNNNATIILGSYASIAKEKEVAVITLKQLIENVALMVEQLIKALAEYEKEKKAQETHELAKTIANSLKSGDPCPVCGGVFRGLHEEIHLSLSSPEKELKEAQGIALELESFLDQLTNGLLIPTDQKLPQMEVAVAGKVNSTASLEDIRRTLTVLKNDYSRWQKTLNNLLKEQTENNKERAQCESKIEAYKTQQEGYREKESALILERDDIKARLEASLGNDFETVLNEQKVEISRKDRLNQTLNNSLQAKEKLLGKLRLELNEISESFQSLNNAKLSKSLEAMNLEESMKKKIINLQSICQDAEPGALKEEKEKELSKLRENVAKAEQTVLNIKKQYEEADRSLEVNKGLRNERQEALNSALDTFNEKMQVSSIDDVKSLEELFALLVDKERFIKQVSEYEKKENEYRQNITRLEAVCVGNKITKEDYLQVKKQQEETESKIGEANKQKGSLEHLITDLTSKIQKANEVNEAIKNLTVEENRYKRLADVLKNGAFLEFVAREQLQVICRNASVKLGHLSRGRYALEIDSENNFVIRDFYNGGGYRSVSSLSGGETFLASLALALALSMQIQLRGRYPLQFFFLDEGFGTLDQELLEVVIDALERLKTENLAVGIISHVPELKARIMRQVDVVPATTSGKGSQIRKV